MRPARVQVVRVDALRQRRCGIVLGISSAAENVADASKDVAAIIKRDDLKSLRERRPRFKIDDRESVSADGHCEWVELNQLALLIAKDAAATRDRRLQETLGDDHARACLFI